MFKPKFTISPEVFGAACEIAEIKAIVERSRVLPLNEMQLTRQALIRMVHTSTTIEGNKLAEYQVGQVLSGMSVVADNRSIKEVKNYFEALRLIEISAKNKDSLTLNFILRIHSIILKELHEEKKKIGNFRPADIFIIDDLGGGREVLRFKGPPAKKVALLLRELLAWLERANQLNMHPILKAGIFHSQFAHIHPFVDGNGRIARLLTFYILYRSGWDFRKVLVLEDFYNRNIQDYKNALAFGWGREYGDIEPDFTDWLEYFVAGFLVESRKVKDKIYSLGFAKSASTDEQIFLDREEVFIVDFITSTGRVTSDDVVGLIKVAKRTAQLKLKKLVDKKLLKVNGKGPSTFYTMVA